MFEVSKVTNPLIPVNNNVNSTTGELQDIQHGLCLNSKNYLEGKSKLSHLLGDRSETLELNVCMG